MHDKSDPRRNHLLDALPEDEYRKLLVYLEPVHIQAGQVLAEPGKKSRHVYFPVSCTISLYYAMDGGISAEIAMIGNEGMFSLVPILGGESMPYVAVAETPGEAYRLDEKILQQEFKSSGDLQHVLLLYVQALFTEMTQISICGRNHSLRAQLCLHLLLLHDRVMSDRFTLTQQAMAHILGVRRESVSKASGELRQAGLIDYKRGQIVVLDRKSLEMECCECYGVVRREFHRLMELGQNHEPRAGA